MNALAAHASRLRIVEAGDAERRRLGRNLHGGAQLRLISCALQVRLAAQSAAAARDEHLREAPGQISDQLHVALDELRDLARGLHPADPADESLVYVSPTRRRSAW